jgi:PAS domain S-box-containing protein
MLGDTCAVTGLPILHKPDWIYINVDNDKKIRISVIGNNIFHTEVFGDISLTDAKSALDVVYGVIHEVITTGYLYAHIFDCSYITDITPEGRKYAIDGFITRDPAPAAMIFYGTSPLLKVSINLAGKLNKTAFEVHITKDYSKAVTLACHTLDTVKVGGNISPVTNVAPRSLTDPGTHTRRIITREDWSMGTDTYSVYFEVIDDDILHSVGTGTFEVRLIEPIEEICKKIIRSGTVSNVPLYFVINLEGIKKVGLKVRLRYMEQMKTWYDKNILRTAIFYGKNRILNASFNLTRPFFPFDVRTVGTLKEALELIKREKIKGKGFNSVPAIKNKSTESATSEQTKQYVDELLRFMGSIRWDVAGVTRDKRYGPSHPLNPVFDALELIKTDVDELLNERKEAEKELRRSNDRYRALFDNNPVDTVIVNSKGVITEYNIAKEKRGGRLPTVNCDVMYKDYAGKHTIDMFEELMKCIESGTSKEFLDQRYKNRFLDVRMAPFSKGAIITSIDITERKQAEDTIRESRQQLSDIINFLPDATFAIDREGRVIIWNHAIEEMTGVKAENILGKGNYEYALPFYGTRRPLLIDLIFEPDEKLEGEYSFVYKEKDFLLAEAEIPFTDGRKAYLWGKVSPLYDLKGNIIGAIESMRDVTDRRREEKELQESEARYRAVFENEGTASAIIENDRTISMVNAKFESLSGYSREELEGRMKWTDFVIAEYLETMKEYHRRRRENEKGVPTEYEFRFIDRQGDIKDILLTVHLIPGTEKTISSLMDITPFKKSLREKELLLKETHHRVKNNMQIISSLLSLQSQYVGNEKSLEIFRESERRIRSMASVHEQLYQSEDLSQIDIVNYTKHLAKELAASYGINTNIFRINADGAHIFLNIEKAVPCGLIISELLSNALKYAFPDDKGGEIVINFHNNQGNGTTLIISDNSMSLTEKIIDITGTETFSLKLVGMLVKQFDAQIELDRSKGTSLKITFP